MTETTLRFACSGCNKQYSCPKVYAGRKTTCAKCGASITVPAASVRDIEAESLTESVSFACGLCGTRMSVPLRYVGRQVKCPDCTHATIVPKPKPKRAKPRPAAMSGEQYEVYEGEEQPRGIDLARASPKSISFECRVCQTHLQAPESEVGKSIVCPDCGVETPVPRRTKPIAKRVLVEDHYEVEADSDEPVVPAVGLFDHYVKTVPAGYRELAERTEKGLKSSGRPEPRGLPLLTDFFGLYRSQSIVSVWLALSLGLALSAVAFTFAMSMLGGAGGAYGAIVGVPALVVTILMGGLVFSGFSAYCLAIVDQSAEGAPKIAHWPPTIPTEWAGESAILLMAVLTTGSIAGLVATAVGVADPVQEFVVPMTLGLVFPWVLLSELDLASPFGIFSPRLLRTLRYALGTWLLFYIETAVGMAAMVAISVTIAEKLPVALILLAPLAAIAAMQYAWLLGRLAWVIGAATPEKDEAVT